MSERTATVAHQKQAARAAKPQASLVVSGSAKRIAKLHKKLGRKRKLAVSALTTTAPTA